MCGRTSFDGPLGPDRVSESVCMCVFRGRGCRGRGGRQVNLISDISMPKLQVLLGSTAATQRDPDESWR